MSSGELLNRAAILQEFAGILYRQRNPGLLGNEVDLEALKRVEETMAGLPVEEQSLVNQYINEIKGDARKAIERVIENNGIVKAEEKADLRGLIRFVGLIRRR